MGYSILISVWFLCLICVWNALPPNKTLNYQILILNLAEKDLLTPDLAKSNLEPCFQK